MTGGGFTLRNTGSVPVSLSAVTLTLGKPGVVDRLTLSQDTNSVTAEVPADATQLALSFNPALTLSPGAALPFSTQARLAAGDADATSLSLTALAAQAGATTVSAEGLPLALGRLSRLPAPTEPGPGTPPDDPNAGRFGGALSLGLLLPLLLCARRRRAS
jgi:hypothetical protein